MLRRISYACTAFAGVLAMLAGPAVAAKKAPDLTVSAIKATGSPAAGQALSVQVKVKNSGRKKAKGSQTSFVLSRDAKAGKGDRKLKTRKVKAIAVKKTAKATLKLTVPAGTNPGAYRVIACADAKKKVKESNERNNCRASKAVTVVSGPFGGPPPSTPGQPIFTPPPGGPGPTPTPTATPTASPTATPTASPTATPTTTPEPDPFPKPPLDPAPDPVDEAPTPPSTGATTVADGTEFLYTGPDPIQREVDPGTIAPKQVAVLRGRVVDTDGDAIPGARITVLDHPELGYTSTRDDGGYDLAVNGGEDLVLQFEQEAFTTLQRTESVPWQDFVRLDDVVMTEYSDPSPVQQDATALTAVTSETTPPDDAAARKATLMFDPGTDATMTLPNGQEQPLDNTLQVAATEYTVGTGGEQRMPGELPDTSAYTYAVEFSVEQAVEAGAVDVEFDKPVATYVDNFLDFKAGTIVPAAYYDKDKAAWVPSEDGIVLEIVSENGGKAQVDVDGNGDADSGAELSDLGIDDAELVKLGQQYDTGDSLWRVQVKHFTPWDYNWPYGCKALCPPPDEEPPPPPYCPECQAAGSIVGVFNQTLGERLSVTGTPFALHYDSGRLPGYKEAYSVEIPVTGGSVAGTLAGVDVQVSVAGRQFSPGANPTAFNCNKDFEGVANLKCTFTWDGKDAYGRTLEGSQTARVRIGYVYPAVYLEPGEFENSFAQFGGRPVSRNDGGGGADTRRTITVWQEWERPVGTLGAGSDALGGWTIDVHHAYDPQAKTLYLGDGTRVNTEAIRSEIRTVAGFDPFDFVFGGTPATQTNLGLVRGIDAGPDGSVYIAETSLNRVVKVTPTGDLEIVAGGVFDDEEDDLGDGGPAREATLTGPSDVAVGPDGTLFITDTGNARIRRVAPDGVITTFAGGGDPDELGDGGSALAASLHGPRGIEVTDDGMVYVADTGADRIRRITPDGRIATAAGGGTPATGIGDGARAVDASLDRPTDVAIDPAGTLLIADADHGRVRSVTPTGLIDTLAGTGGAGSSGDDGPATSAQIGQPTAVAAGRDGSVYVADRIHHTVRRIAPDGTITRHAGTGTSGGEGDGGAPQQAQLSFPQALAVSPDASLLIGDAGNGRVRRAALGLPGFTDADFSLPSEDGTVVYQFDRNGRHLRTVDALTGTTRYRFGYDSAGRLTTITEKTGPAATDALVTTITRDSAGKATGIVAPGAGSSAPRRTTLAINGAGWLGSVANPMGEQTDLAYGAGGLLTTFTDPLDRAAHFAYQASTGLLTSDTDRSGSATTYARTRTASGARVTSTSEAGRVTTYDTAKQPDGSTRTTVTEPSGAATVTAYGSDGVTRVTSPDGTVTSAKSGPDPRWGMRAPIPAEVTTTTPGGRSRTVTRERAVTLTTEGDPFAIDELTDTSSHDGGTDTMTYDGATRVATTHTAADRTFTTKLDANGRMIERATGGGTDPIQLRWNTAGRVDRIAQGAHVMTMGYDPSHPYRLLTRTDGGSHTTTYAYDNAERITSVALPSGKTYAYGYDANGNRTRVEMPNHQVHAYTFDALGRATGYDPSGAASDFGRAFDADGLATGFTLAGGGGQTLVRQASGRLSGVTSPDGTASTFAYPAGDGTDRFTTARRTLPGSRSDESRLTYDGPLVTGKESRDAGGAYATHTYAYDDRLRLEEIDLAAGADSLAQTISYDSDALVTAQGPFAFARGGPAGQISGVTGEGLSLAIAYAATGTERKRTTRVGSTAVFDTEITRDNAGRITQKVEKSGAAAAVTYAYTYTADGELATVKRGATTVEQYAYDANGNRTSAKYGAAAAQPATFAADDHQLTRAGIAHTFDAAGMLTARGADTFSYSDSGELLEATVGGTLVRYVYDTAGRRVARIQGGATYRYIYGDPRRPLAVTATRAGDGTLTTYSYDTHDRLFALRRGGTRYFVATDHLGTPRVVTNASGAVVKQLDYDAFGVRASDSAPAFDLPIGFAGGIDDRLTGLVRFGFRDYDPAAGRWTARDPIYQSGGPNTYAYVGNDPVGTRDPMGLEGGFSGWLSGVAQSVSDFFTSDSAGTAMDVVSSIDSDSPIVEAAGTLSGGIDKVQTVQEGLDLALEAKEAFGEPTDPEQAAGLLKCGLKLLKKILPVDLIGIDAASETLDRGMENAKDQRDFGTINKGAQRQLAEMDL